LPNLTKRLVWETTSQMCELLSISRAKQCSDTSGSINVPYITARNMHGYLMNWCCSMSDYVADCRQMKGL